MRNKVAEPCLYSFHALPLGALRRRGGLRSLLRLGTAAGALLLAAPHASKAYNLYSGYYAGQNLEVSLNTTLEYSNIFRVNDPSAVILRDANGNEGDDNFRHGLVSNQFEITPIFDVKYGNYGVHVSGEAFLNTVYLQHNQNNSPATFNPISTADNRSFTTATRNVNGENAKLLDAFVYGSRYFGADGQQVLTVKLGRQTLLWGQSLLFASDGISAGQAPVDLQVAQTEPNAEAQQLFLPVGQAVVTYQPSEDITLQGYYQFEWEPNNFEGSGSYFSSSDIYDKGGQRLLLGPTKAGPAFYRVKNNQPPSSNGQFGVSVQGHLGNYDLGLFALRYDAKTPKFYLGAPQAGKSSSRTNAGSYWVAYGRDIQLYGASFSTNVGPANVAGEISYRRNAPLVSGLERSATYPGSTNAGALYAVGQVVNGQISMIYASPGLSFDPGGISVIGEFNMNSVVAIDRNRAALTQAPNRQATAGAFQFVVTPTYFFNVMPNVEFNFPFGVEYGLFNRSEFDPTENHGTGTVNVGVKAIYKVTWTAGLTYVDYIGAPSTVLQGDAAIADRGYVSFNIEHTF